MCRQVSNDKCRQQVSDDKLHCHLSYEKCMHTNIDFLQLVALAFFVHQLFGFIAFSYLAPFVVSFLLFHSFLFHSHIHFPIFLFLEMKS